MVKPALPHTDRCLAHVDDGALRAGPRRGAEDFAVAVGQGRLALEELHYRRGAAVEFTRVEDGRDAGHPQTVAAAAPAEPALLGQVGQRGRIARQVGQAMGTRFVVSEGAVGLMAGHAGDVTHGGHARVTKELAAQGDGQRLARHTVAGVAQHRRRPGPEAEDLLQLGRREVVRARGDGGRGSRAKRRRAGQAKAQQATRQPSCALVGAMRREAGLHAPTIVTRARLGKRAATIAR